MTIVIYSWMIPLAVTITAFAFLRVMDANDQFGIGAALNQVAALIRVVSPQVSHINPLTSATVQTGWLSRQRVSLAAANEKIVATRKIMLATY